MKPKFGLFYRSSSFKMAILFSSLLFFAVAILILLIINSSDEQLAKSWLLWFSISLMVSVTVISFFVATYVVKRINSISSTAQTIIETGKLNARIPMDFEWDDLSQLAYILNQLLAEIEGLLKNVSQVSNNIAHDLRTPLTRLRNQIQSLEHQDDKERLTDEVDKLLDMFNGLLRIANIEAKKRYQAFEKTDLSLLLEDAIELYEPLASDKSIEMSFTPSHVFMEADRDLLFQAITNLIDNAIKYTPAQYDSESTQAATIQISLFQSDRHTEIHIADKGSGISPNEYNMVTRRFYRTDKTRSNKGYGLGLALVNAVIKLHGGKIVFDRNEPVGLVVKLIFPISLNNRRSKSKH